MKLTKEFAERCRVLGDTFLLLHLEGEDRGTLVDMLEPRFEPCGTIACHAGWFAIARNLESTLDFGYEESAIDMAVYLGFSGAIELKEWAHENESLWGNPEGSNLFCSPDAFGKVEEELTLEDIGLHWHGVADRVEERLGERE